MECPICKKHLNPPFDPKDAPPENLTFVVAHCCNGLLWVRNAQLVQAHGVFPKEIYEEFSRSGFELFPVAVLNSRIGWEVRPVPEPESPTVQFEANN